MNPDTPSTLAPPGAGAAQAVPATAQKATLRRDALVAGLGTFVALAAVGGLAALSGQALVLGSFGASCVLLFGFPAGPFSQPRNVFGGHMLAATVGLAFLAVFGPGWLPMAAAAAVAVALMILTKTVHPPAGSNPVIIFVGHGTWSFLFMPTATGAAMLLAIAWTFWRAQGTTKWPTRWW